MRKKLPPSLSLPESYNSIEVLRTASFWKKIVAFTGPGYLIAAGYMDPGNWATGLTGGAQFGYTLLSIIFLSNLIAILLQYLSIKLGIIARYDLAQACKKFYSRPFALFLWILAEIAIIACDLAEVVGAAIGLNLLFGVPLTLGVIITAFDVLLLLMFYQKNMRFLEIIIIIITFIIMICFGINLFLAKPSLYGILAGLLPSSEILKNPEMLYVAAGILGATVMPHNLYLHSALVQTRNIGTHQDAKKSALQCATIDILVALTLAFFVNAAILILAAAVFHTPGYTHVSDIQEAYQLFTPLLKTSIASFIFALALLLSGQSSAITGTLAGQIIMEGFINFKMAPWIRRLISRGLAIIPTIIAILLYGSHGLHKLLIFSQVILSLQLSFAVFPLIQFTSSVAIMGKFANQKSLKIVAYITAIVIVMLNVWLVYSCLSS